MKDALKKVALGLLGSKKFMATAAGFLVTVAAYPLIRWAGLEQAQALELVKPIVGGIVTLVGFVVAAQGVADHGKERAKIETAAAKHTTKLDKATEAAKETP